MAHSSSSSSISTSSTTDSYDSSLARVARRMHPYVGPTIRRYPYVRPTIALKRPVMEVRDRADCSTSTEGRPNRRLPNHPSSALCGGANARTAEHVVSAHGRSSKCRSKSGKCDLIEENAKLKQELAKCKTQLATRDDNRECKICFKNPPDILIIPCKHAQFCTECIEKLRRNSNKCPICRAVIDCTIFIHI